VNELGKVIIRETESGWLFMRFKILSRLEFASLGESSIECERATESEIRHYRDTRDSHSLSRLERAALARDYRESRSLGLIIEGVLRD